MKRASDEEQRREKPNEPGTSDMALKVLINLAVRSKNQAQELALTAVNLDTLLEIFQNRKRSSSKGQHHAKRAEVQEDNDSGEIEMSFPTIGLKAGLQCNDWIVDSVARRHMTFESNILHVYKDFEAPEPAGLGDGRTRISYWSW